MDEVHRAENQSYCIKYLGTPNRLIIPNLCFLNIQTRYHLIES